MESTITAVVLAGGEGKRFMPFLGDKTLFPLLGKPLIYHVLSLLPVAGISRALVITNSGNDEIIKNLSIDGLTIDTLVQKEPKGMADALLSAGEHLPAKDMLVMNGVDIVDATLLQDIVLNSEKYEALVAGMKQPHYTPAGYLKFDGEKVIGIVEKPKKGSEPSEYINLVFHYFKHSAHFVRYLEKQQSSSDDVYEKAFTAFMSEYKVGFVPYSMYWVKLKYPHFALDVIDLFLERIKPYKSPTAIISEHAIIEGAVYIDDGAKIFEGAIVKGPSYIGRNAVIGNHTLVRNSVIEESAVVGFGSEVARSYIGPHCMLHHNYIGDSVLEAYVNPSYGTTTANWRLDGAEVEAAYEEGRVNTYRRKFGAVIGAHTFFGVNCSIMPGTVIGHHVTIYPGSMVKGYIPARSTVGFDKKR